MNRKKEKKITEINNNCEKKFENLLEISVRLWFQSRHFRWISTQLRRGYTDPRRESRRESIVISSYGRWRRWRRILRGRNGGVSTARAPHDKNHRDNYPKSCHDKKYCEWTTDRKKLIGQVSFSTSRMNLWITFGPGRLPGGGLLVNVKLWT